jgi:hypothetical protein
MSSSWMNGMGMVTSRRVTSARSGSMWLRFRPGLIESSRPCGRRVFLGGGAATSTASRGSSSPTGSRFRRLKRKDTQNCRRQLGHVSCQSSPPVYAHSQVDTSP